MSRVTTQDADPVISGEGADPAAGTGIVAADASEIAGISYRQLDHWARQQWVVPSVDAGTGRAGRRRYSAEDVVRLDLLRYLAQSKVNTAVAGPAVSRLHVPDGDVIILWGPVGGDECGLRVLAFEDAVTRLESGGAHVWYSPTRVRRRMARALGALGAPGTMPEQVAVEQVAVEKPSPLRARSA